MLKRLLLFFWHFFLNPSEGPQDFEPDYEIDIEKLIKTLKLDQRARDAARHELPSTDARGPDATERKIQTLVQKRMIELTHAANQKLIGYNTTLLNTDLNHPQQRIRNLAEHAKLRLNSLLAEAEQRLRIMKSELDRHTAYYRSFQHMNRRETDAEYPDSLVYHYSLVLLLLLVEALANGYFFARGSEFGMLGGISQSLIVAALNVVPAFLLAGILLRYLHHIHPVKRILAFAAMLVFSVWIVLFNFSVAHYRELLGLDGEIAVTRVIDRLVFAPFALADLNSWLLFAMGIFFALVAMIDGYRSDDPYPGYGKVQRLNDEIRERYELECQKLSAEANGIRSEFQSELTVLRDQAKSTFMHLCHLAEARPALVAKHRYGLEALARAGDVLIHHYRSTNSCYRKTPAPAYFSESWRPENSFDLIGAHEERERFERQRKLFESFPEFLEKTSNDLERVYMAFFERLQRIEPAIQPAVMVQ